MSLLEGDDACMERRQAELRPADPCLPSCLSLQLKFLWLQHYCIRSYSICYYCRENVTCVIQASCVLCKCGVEKRDPRMEQMSPHCKTHKTGLILSASSPLPYMVFLDNEILNSLKSVVQMWSDCKDSGSTQLIYVLFLGFFSFAFPFSH